MLEIWRVYRVPIILGCISLVFILLSITIFIKSYQFTQPITFSSDVGKSTAIGEATRSAESAAITVDIEGAVAKPGVYHLPMGVHVEEGIAAAGGLSKNADTDAIAKTLNRAAKLSEGAKLYIPTKSQGDVSLPSSIPGDNGIVSTMVNVNSASQSELEGLSGIGPVTAGKIVAGRPYMRLEELVEKKALGQTLFTKLKDQLTL